MKLLHEPARRMFSVAASFMVMQQAPDVVHLERSTAAPPAATAPAHAKVPRVSASEGWVSFQRFWTADGQTLVDAMIRVPPIPGSTQPLETTVIVQDTAGNVLLQETWADSASKLGGMTLEHEIAVPVRFVLANGKYVMKVHARRGLNADSGSVLMEAFALRPLGSDLILSPSVRSITHSQRVGLPDVAHGDYAVESWPHAVRDTQHPRTFYFLELYPSPEEIGAEAKLSFDIIRLSDGKKFKGSGARVKKLADPVNADFGQLALDGFKPGEYRLEITIEAPHRKEIREGYFVIAD
jgi:hypothetical protein